MLQSLGDTIRRKTRVIFGLTLLLIAGIVICYINFGSWVWFCIGLLLIFIFVFGLPIVKAKNCYPGDHLILIGDNDKIEYEHIIEIKKVSSNFLYRHIIWSVRESRYQHSVAWDAIKITYLNDDVIRSAIFLVDPNMKGKYEQFIRNCKEQNPKIVFKVKDRNS